MRFDNLNPDTGNFKPPFKLGGTVTLPVIQDAQTLNLFDNYLLVGESGTPGNYTLIQDIPFQEAWTRETPALPSGTVYEPAYANDIVIMTGTNMVMLGAIRRAVE